MLGLVGWSGERKVALGRTQVLGLPVLRASVPRGGRWEKHRLERAARLMERHRVHRVLVPREFKQWHILERRGLTGVDTLPLYRAMADRLVLAQLGRMGIQVRNACIALRAERIDADLVRTARLLCPQVRALAIQVDRGGERLIRELYWEFGAPAAVWTDVDAAVRFSGEGQKGELVLCGRPELLGLELDASELTLPEELEPLPLLTALWQAGLLKAENVRVAAK